MGKALNSKNFYYDVMELVTKYREAGILDDELLDEIEEVQLDLKTENYSPFEEDEVFRGQYGLDDPEDY